MELPDPYAELPVPVYPPREWLYEIPDWFDIDSPAVQLQLSGPECGRVAVLVAPFDEAIIGSAPGKPWYPPRSKTGYEYAHVGTTITADGEAVRTANIGGSINHMAVDAAIPISMAADHYANTATRMMRGRFHDTDHGIIFLGAMQPGVKVIDAINALAGSVSGDWRWVEKLGDRELAGAQWVNTPAFRRTPQAGAPAARFAIAASLGHGPAFGQWIVVDASPEERLAVIEAKVAAMLLRRVPDVELDA